MSDRLGWESDVVFYASGGSAKQGPRPSYDQIMLNLFGPWDLRATLVDSTLWPEKVREGSD